MSIPSVTGPLSSASLPSGTVATPTAPAAAEPSGFAKVLRGLGDQVEQGEKFMHDAKHSIERGNLSAAQLLAIQEGVYRYGVAVDLTSKVVAEATNGLKTIVQAQ